MVVEFASKMFTRDSIHESPLAMPYAVFLSSLLACVLIRVLSAVLEKLTRMFNGSRFGKRSTGTSASIKHESLMRRENSIASSLSSTSASVSATSDVETESSSSFYSPHFSIPRRRGRGGLKKAQHTAGYEQWCRLREAWLQPDGTTEPTEPGLFNYIEVYETLSQDKKRADLPQPVKLGDILEVYQEIWDRGESS